MDKLKRPFGFNVIGYISGNLGLGVAARNLVRLITEHGVPVSVYDLDPGLGRRGQEREFEDRTVPAIEDLPYAVNLFVLGLTSLELLVAEHQQSLFRGGYLNAVVPFWELSILPPRTIPTLEAMDVIVTVSESIRCALQFVLSGPLIISGRLPIYLPQNVTPDRRRFGLPDDAVIFTMSFEPASDPQRKNPLAVIDAFVKAVGDVPSGYLVVRINNARTESGDHPALGDIPKSGARHPRIRFVTGKLTYRDVVTLYASCDVYVSLHRAEGVGLGPMEAMALGKPVIATAWSGNMSFMDHTNACLVSYQLIPVESTIKELQKAYLGEGAYWADPNVDEAAAWMRRLVAGPSLRARIGGRASQDIARYQSEAKHGHLLKEIQAIYKEREFLPPRPKQTARPQHMQELLLARDRRIAQLESELRWITGKPTFRLLKVVKNLFTKGLRA